MRIPSPDRSFLKRIRGVSLLARFAMTSLVVFVVIGFALARTIGIFTENSALGAAKAAAIDNLSFLRNQLSASDFQGVIAGPRFAQLDRLVRHSVLNNRIKVVKVWSPQGMVLYSTDRNIIGHRFPLESDVLTALRGHNFADVSSLSDEEDQDDRGFGRLLQVYVPIRLGSSGPVIGAFEIYETYGPLGSQINQLQTQTAVIVGGGLLMLYLVLFGIVRTGSRTISRQQTQLTEHARQLEQTYGDIIASLAAAVEARDAQTEQHSERVTALALRLGRYVGLGADDLRMLRIGAQLHDVGKIGVPDAILRKTGPLSDEEWGAMRAHPLIGFGMIHNVGSVRDALPVVRNHHERWDGSGYPDSLAGEAIPLAARIFSIVDAFDAITSDRSYRAGGSAAEALSRIEAGAGTQFDPVLAISFVAMMSNARREQFANRSPLTPAA